jgi:hypothetical protein
MRVWLFEKLKKRYPRIKHGPDPECLRCHGSGEIYFAYALHDHVTEGWRPCLCLYTDHKHLQAVSRMIKGKVRIGEEP